MSKFLTLFQLIPLPTAKILYKIPNQIIIEKVATLNFPLLFLEALPFKQHHQSLQVSIMDESGEYPKEYYTSNGNPRRLTSTSSSSSSTTSVHVTALDGLVNVNSLFTIAVFVGLSLATPGQHSLENRAPCDAGIDVAKKLLVFEVVSFSFFLFSSLVAQGLKLAINLLNSKDVDEAFRAHINLKVLRFGMMGSAVGSVMGCLFLMLSMVNVIEIRLGLLSCGSQSSIHATAALVILVSSALLIYISTAVYAFLH
ncbi:hypothetical protein ERO13_A11G143400v2 [Gossypium hirsutum]|uniref:Maternal effect embryo arrest protein n=1 Tax=Gossypium hirsutum TaxID=3635 RepID=A0A1U8L1F4_GOSHI|nr:uncharacterized protein LOC107922827 [Gossypium hirsutum]KAG4174806.1 hypothetical protein ERO13_A11G143400v2 [Gossypium hirsutum]